MGLWQLTNTNATDCLIQRWSLNTVPAMLKQKKNLHILRKMRKELFCETKKKVMIIIRMKIGGSHSGKDGLA